MSQKVDKYTDDAIRVFLLAKDEARRLRLPTVGSALLLVGFVMESRGPVAKILKAAGVTKERVRRECENLIERGTGSPKEIPFTSRCNKILERAAAHASALKENEVSGESLMLALLEERGGSGVTILSAMGISADSLRREIVEQRARRIEEARLTPNPHTYRQGDVVLILQDTRDLDGKIRSKKRPMVVVSSDECNIRLKKIVVVPVKIRIKDMHSDVLDIAIRASSAAGQAAGIRDDSVVACTVVYSFPKSCVVEKIGALPPDLAREVCQQVMNLVKPAD